MSNCLMSSRSVAPANFSIRFNRCWAVKWFNVGKRWEISSASWVIVKGALDEIVCGI